MMIKSPVISTIPSSSMDAISTAPIKVLDNSMVFKATSVGTVVVNPFVFAHQHFKTKKQLPINGKKRSPSGYNLFFHMIREDVLLCCQNKTKSGCGSTVESNKHSAIFSKTIEDLLKYHVDYFNPKRIEEAAHRLRMKPKRKHVKQKNGGFPISFHELTQIVSKEWKILLPSVRQMFLTQAIAETEYYNNQQTSTTTAATTTTPIIKQQQQQKPNGSLSVNKTKITCYKKDLTPITSNQIMLVKSIDYLQQQLVVPNPQPVSELQTQLQTQIQSPLKDPQQQQSMQPDPKEQQDILNHTDAKQNQDFLYEYKLQSIRNNKEINYGFEQEIENHSIKNNSKILEVTNALKNQVVVKKHSKNASPRKDSKVKGTTETSSSLINSNRITTMDQSLLYDNVFGDLFFNFISEDEASDFNPIKLELEDYDNHHFQHNTRMYDNEKETPIQLIDPMSDYDPMSSHLFYDRLVPSNQLSNNQININQYINVRSEQDTFLTNHRDVNVIQHNMMKEHHQQQGMVDYYSHCNNNNNNSNIGNNNKNQSLVSPSHPSLYHIQKMQNVQLWSQNQQEMMLHQNQHLVLDDDSNTSYYPPVEPNWVHFMQQKLQDETDSELISL